MSDRLPPLTALRAFESAARHLSFAKAAAELNVTPAALSFQIKSLEEHLGQPLFHRLNRAVRLTEAGRALSPGATEGFDTLTQAWRAARRLTDTRTLNVTAGPAFTAKWLAPRLYDFARLHPEIDLRFTASLRLMDFDLDEIDVAIRYGYGTDTHLSATPLSHREWLTPVMRPDMVAQFPTPQSLLRAPLLHNASDDFLSPRTDWPAWFRAVGITEPPQVTTTFSQPDHALDAALEGAGVVLARNTFARRDLDQGRLVAPFGTAISTRAHFRLLCQKAAESRPQVRAFRDWITAQMRGSDDLPDGMTIIPVEDLTP